MSHNGQILCHDVDTTEYLSRVLMVVSGCNVDGKHEPVLYYCIKYVQLI